MTQAQVRGILKDTQGAAKQDALLALQRWKCPYKVGGAKVWWIALSSKTLCAQYMLALLQATQHSKEVHHLRSVQYYVDLLEERESNAPARDPRGTQFKFGAEVHPENAQKGSKRKVTTSAKSQGALSDVSDGVSDDDNNRDGKHSGDVDAGDSDVGYDSSVSEDVAGDNTEDESIGDDDTSHAIAVGRLT